MDSIKSSSSNPDLGWSQLKETILMINLAVSQIDHAMHEGGRSVDTLAHSFTHLAHSMDEIVKIADNLPPGEEKETLMASTKNAVDEVSQAVVAFQFYDKLSQRLAHVSSDLDGLVQLINDPHSLYSPPAWNALQHEIREGYTMKEEREMFDKVMAGMSIEKALEEFIQQREQAQAEDDDIELF